MDLGILFPKKDLTNQIQKLRNMSPRITSTIISFYDDYWKNQNLFLPSHIFFWLRICQKVFLTFLWSKKRNVSSPELCDICATCFVSTKYNINSFFNFNHMTHFFSDQIKVVIRSNSKMERLYNCTTFWNAFLFASLLHTYHSSAKPL